MVPGRRGRWLRRLSLATALSTVATVATGMSGFSSSPLSSSALAGPPGGGAFDDMRYAEELTEFEALRIQLAERYLRATGDQQQAVRRIAREALTTFLADSVFPAWMGTRWAMGKRANATRPHQPGRAVSCSTFVAAALGDGGVRLAKRSAFGQAAAIDIQRSLIGDEETVHRFVGISSDDLAAEMVALGDGIYLIGLRKHVGFVHVGQGRATLVHAGASGSGTVQREPLADALSVRVSHPSGFWVTSLTGSKYLLESWLAAKPHRLVRHGLP